MNSKKFGLVAIAVILVGGIGWYSTSRNDDAAPTNQATATATPEQAKEVSYQGQDGKTALVILKEKYTVETSSTSFGEMVQGINGLKADDKHYWAFKVNGVDAMVGAGDYASTSADTISWVYTEL